jgi:hypothetical protein
MFQSFEYKGQKSGKSCKYIDVYEVTDSEFGIIQVIGDDFFVDALIKEYSKRNMNVAANLAVAFVWYNKKFPHHSIQDTINFSKKYSPRFKKYEKDLQKYLQKYLVLL